MPRCQRRLLLRQDAVMVKCLSQRLDGTVITAQHRAQHLLLQRRMKATQNHLPVLAHYRQIRICVTTKALRDIFNQAIKFYAIAPDSPDTAA